MPEQLLPHRLLATCKAIEAIALCGPISFASIARQTGLAPRETADAIDYMLAHGWIREIGQRQSGASPSNPIFETMPEAASIAVVDLGGTNVRVAISDLSGNIRSLQRGLTHPRGGMHVVLQIASLCRQAADHAGVPFNQVRVVVVGVPGVPNRTTGSVRMAPNIAGLDEFDVRSALRKALEINAILENDVNAALLGEHWAGENRGVDNLVYVKVGTGIGAGVLCNGAIVRGSSGAGGQISSMPIGADPEDPESLRRGALERAAAGDGITDRYRVLSGQRADAAEIFERAASGDSAAATSLDDAARNIALSLGATCAMIDPEKFILGGTIGSRKEIVDRVARALERIHPDPAPVVAETPDFEAALLGCAYLGLRYLSASLLGQVAVPKSMGAQ